jgi:hypothetical protein
MQDWGSDLDWHWQSAPEVTLEQLLPIWQNAVLIGNVLRSAPVFCQISVTRAAEPTPANLSGLV